VILLKNKISKIDMEKGPESKKIKDKKAKKVASEGLGGKDKSREGVREKLDKFLGEKKGLYLAMRSLFLGLSGEGKEKDKRGLEDGLDRAMLKALESQESKGPVEEKAVLREFLNNLPKEQFPGIAEMKEKDPKAAENLIEGLIGALKEKDKGEMEKKLTDVLEKYNFKAEANKDIKNITEGIAVLREEIEAEKISPKEAKQRFDEIKKKGGGLLEKIMVAGGMIGCVFLLGLVVAFLWEIKAVEKMLGMNLAGGGGKKKQ